MQHSNRGNTSYSITTQPNTPKTMKTIPSTTATSADDARQWICELADHHSWEIVAKEMISRMSSDEAEEFVEYFIFKGDLGR